MGLVKEVRGLNPTFNSADIRGEFMSPQHWKVTLFKLANIEIG